jgi:DMSO/TMAO reductase YedYZ molybdopterin-dependent catalytic subunit
VDLGSYRLKVAGAVSRQLSLSLEELGALVPFRQVKRRFYCVNGWTMMRRWAGYGLADLLEVAGPRARLLRATSLYGYEDTSPVAGLVAGDALLATHLDDEPLSADRGSPVRLLLFHCYQFKGVKALAQLEVTDEYRSGTWQRFGYEDATIQTYPHLDIDSRTRIAPDFAPAPRNPAEDES